LPTSFFEELENLGEIQTAPRLNPIKSGGSQNPSNLSPALELVKKYIDKP